MTWQAALDRDAVAVAFPDWTWTVGDKVTVFADFERGWADTAPGEGFSIYVRVDRDGAIRDREYVGEEAAVFFNALMARGSATGGEGDV